jgi:hypothetical protein
MKRFWETVRGAGKYAYDVRVLYALTGLILSILAHELVHVLMHFGDINAVHFLPNLSTIVAINLDSIQNYDMNTEELVAYAVSGLVQLITIIDVFAIHDSYDRKPVGKLIFNKYDELSENDSKLLLQLISK